MSDQLFVPGTPIDTSIPLVVNVFHEEWLQHYPEIAEVAAIQPEWEGKTFLVWPVQDMLNQKALDLLAAIPNDDTRTVKNYPHPITDAKGKVIAVVVHQVGGYTAYDSLYTYRGHRR